MAQESCVWNPRTSSYRIIGACCSSGATAQCPRSATRWYLTCPLSSRRQKGAQQRFNKYYVLSLIHPSRLQGNATIRKKNPRLVNGDLIRYHIRLDSNCASTSRTHHTLVYGGEHGSAPWDHASFRGNSSKAILLNMGVWFNSGECR